MSKENKVGKENLSPTPPIREKGETKESSSRPPRAREKVTDLVVLDIHTPPTLETLLAWAHSRKWMDDDYTRKWFEEMATELFWCHPVTGQPLNHWPAYFRRCYLTDHRKGESCSKRGRNRQTITRHADNWLGTDKEDIQNVLG